MITKIPKAYAVHPYCQHDNKVKRRPKIHRLKQKRIDDIKTLKGDYNRIEKTDKEHNIKRPTLISTMVLMSYWRNMEVVESTNLDSGKTIDVDDWESMY